MLPNNPSSVYLSLEHAFISQVLTCTSQRPLVADSLLTGLAYRNGALCCLSWGCALSSPKDVPPSSSVTPKILNSATPRMVPA